MTAPIHIFLKSGRLDNLGHALMLLLPKRPEGRRLPGRLERPTRLAWVAFWLHFVVATPFVLIPQLSALALVALINVPWDIRNFFCNLRGKFEVEVPKESPKWDSFLPPYDLKKAISKRGYRHISISHQFVTIERRLWTYTQDGSRFTLRIHP